MRTLFEYWISPETFRRTGLSNIKRIWLDFTIDVYQAKDEGNCKNDWNRLPVKLGVR
jgi:hypothetical protein